MSAGVAKIEIRPTYGLQCYHNHICTVGVKRSGRLHGSSISRQIGNDELEFGSNGLWAISLSFVRRESSSTYFGNLGNVGRARVEVYRLEGLADLPRCVSDDVYVFDNAGRSQRLSIAGGRGSEGALN
jgi:hypothetical protein